MTVPEEPGSSTAVPSPPDVDQHRRTLAEAERLLDDVERALERIAAGRYDVCERCQGPIGAERLEEEPTARTCGSCAGATGPPPSPMSGGATGPDLSAPH